MKTNTERILTTHVGSLPRPEKLIEMLFARYQHQDCDEAEFNETTARAVVDIVQKQVESGIDIVSDGEMGKISYSQYIKHRLNGMTDESSGVEKTSTADFGAPPPDFVEHPDWARQMKVRKRRSYLFHGPTGTGKTFTIKILANLVADWFESLTGHREPRVIFCDASDFFSPYFGESETKIVNWFRKLGSMLRLVRIKRFRRRTPIRGILGATRRDL